MYGQAGTVGDAAEGEFELEVLEGSGFAPTEVSKFVTSIPGLNSNGMNGT